MDIDTDADTIRMCDVLNMYDLTKHVSVLTYRSGHTLDIIITRCNRELLLSNHVADYMVSDHNVCALLSEYAQTFLSNHVADYMVSDHNVCALLSEYAQTFLSNHVADYMVSDHNVCALPSEHAQTFLSNHVADYIWCQTTMFVRYRVNMPRPSLVTMWLITYGVRPQCLCATE